MSKIVIGIHGMGNKPEAAQLRKWWKEAIREGLHGVDRFRYMKFELVYWASILHNHPLNANSIDTEDPYFLEEPFVKGLAHPENHSEKLFSQKIRDKINEQLDNLFIEKKWKPSFKFPL